MVEQGRGVSAAVTRVIDEMTMMRLAIDNGANPYANLRDAEGNLAEEEDVEDILRIVRPMLSGTPVIVTTEMCDLLGAAIKSYPLDGPPPELFTPTGMAWFEGGSIWMRWAKEEVALGSGLNAHEERVAELRAISWSVSHGITMFCGWTMDDELGLIPTLPAVWTDDLDGNPIYTFLKQSFGALMVLCQQRIAIVTTRSADRASVRRGQRVGITVPLLKVVTLRRPMEPSATKGANDVEWSRRWIVDGHWRNHYFPSSGEHRPMWIAPHVKGPEDKPLVIQKRAYRLAR